MLPSDNKISERELNPLPELCLSGSAFIASFTASSKQSFIVKSVFKSSDHMSNS